MIHQGEVLLGGSPWLGLFSVSNTSFTWMGIFFLRFGLWYHLILKFLC
jgi:hypothetical protein